MTDCSSIQGSTSSSSDAMSSRSDGGGSSCINTSSRIRVIRMIRPNSRRIVLGPENISIGFGFAVRGGKEFGTGFFVSRIEKGGEADSKGLRVGDQIIRVNGYNVEDAVHKELTQFISSQDRLTLKVRGVGMLPIKEKTLDTLTWHIVPRHALTTTLAALDEHMTIKDIRIILNVEPKTKLGLGICKGPEWKPGIFVQFTKDFSVARESGLRPGDQILSCNSIDFSDVLFSEAVAVMKSSQTLEMIVRTGAGLDLFPGESSGYNSSASSVTGDQSPCWGDQSAKRLSMVREESISKQWNENNCNNSTNLDRRKNFHKNLTRPIINNNNNNNLNQCITTTNDLQPNNKTIIQLSESGTLINNTLITNPNNNTKSENLIIRPNQQQHHPQHLSMNFITPDYNAAALALNEGNRNSSNNTNDQPNEENNTGKLNGKIADICFVSRQSETKTVIVEVHRSAADENKNNNNDNTNDMNTNGIVNVARRSTNTTNSIPPKPPILPSLSLSSNTSSSSSPSPPSSVTDGLNDRSSSVASSIISSGGTSLCSAISEELKKRKERLSQCSNQTNNENNNNMETIINAANSRLQPKRGGCVSVLGGNDDYRHNALMDEFKRAHRKMFKNGFQETEEERQEELRKTSMMCDETDHRSTPHQQQTLPFNNNNHNNNNDIINKNHNQINHNNNKNYSNGHQNGVTKTELIQNNVMNNGQFPTPPPPPQFSNNPPMIKISDDENYTENNQNLSIIPPPPPPETPIPDYDSTPMNSMRKQPQQQHYHANGCVRVATTTTTSANVGTIGRVASTETAKANGDIGELESIDSFKLQNPSSPQPKPPSAYFVAQSSGPPTMKKSIRPVSVTIGEYGGGAIGYRKEPSKFDFIAKSNESSPTSSLPSPTTPTNNSIKDDSGNVSHMLRSELEMTLSRSNLKKRNEFDRNGSVINQIQNGGVYQNGSNGITQNGNGIQQIQNGENKIQNGNCNYQKYQNDIVQNGGSKSVLHKTQSTNIEKLTNMLQNKQHIFEQNNNDRSATLTNSNRVTINIPNNKTTITTSTGKIELRKTESTPTNGILKNGLNRTSYIDKSISFGN